MEFIKGTLDVLILKPLTWGPLHGYAISRWIQTRSGEAFTPSQGALYPALRRLQARGLVTSAWERSETGRDVKVYRLTQEGQSYLDRSVREWGEYVEAMGSILYATDFGP